jgi:hypothetical protein
MFHLGGILYKQKHPSFIEEHKTKNDYISHVALVPYSSFLCLAENKREEGGSFKTCSAFLISP